VREEKLNLREGEKLNLREGEKTAREKKQ